MWTTIHMLSNGQALLRHWCIVVISNITIHIYVIHWDALSHRMSNDIQLHIVIWCIDWRNTRDSLRWHRIVHWMRTWAGACEVANLGNVLNKIARIVTAQTAHLNGNSLRSSRISWNFIEKHRKPLWHKGSSWVKQGNPLPFRCRIDEKPCKSTV